MYWNFSNDKRATTQGDELRHLLSVSLSVVQPDCANKVMYTDPEKMDASAAIDTDALTAAIDVARLKQRLLSGEFNWSALHGYRGYALAELGVCKDDDSDDAKQQRQFIALYGSFQGTHLECYPVYLWEVPRPYVHLMWSNPVQC